MKRAILSATKNEPMDSLIKRLQEATDGELEVVDNAKIVNLGNGTLYIILENNYNREVAGMKVTGHPDHYDTDVIYDYIMKTYE